MLKAGMQFIRLQAGVLALLMWAVAPAGAQVLFPHDYGNGQVLTFSGGSPGGNYELKVLSPNGDVVPASEAFLDVTFISHRQVRVSARNVTIETYRSFYTLIGPRGSTLMLAAGGIDSPLTSIHPYVSYTR